MDKIHGGLAIIAYIGTDIEARQEALKGDRIEVIVLCNQYLHVIALAPVKRDSAPSEALFLLFLLRFLRCFVSHNLRGVFLFLRITSEWIGV